MNDELVLTVGGKKLTGWTEVSVVRSIEGLPNTFNIRATEGEGGGVLTRAAPYIQAGQACTVSLGADKVITGYCDTVASSFSPGAHAVRVTGRGKCQDLVDCAAEWKGCQIRDANPLQIAQKLASPYGISVKIVGDPGPTVPQFNINVGDTPAQVLELVCRHAAILFFEDTDGDLVLAPIGTDRAGSGFVEGQNVQAAGWSRSVSRRFSEYVCSLLSIDTSGFLSNNDGLFFFTAKDPNVTRHRRRVIVAEGVAGGHELAQRRAEWEAARAYGRGSAVSVTVDNWRDGKGKLWTPNTLASASLPHLGLGGVTWLISEVAYSLALGSGRTATLTLMPPEAFKPEPVMLQPVVGGAEGPTP
jgi:prophage tail gpP-like protein